MKKTVAAYLIYKLHDNQYDIWTHAPYSVSEYALLDTKEIEFDVPDDFDPRPAQIAALKEKQTKAAAAFHAMNTEIMRQINELQALEMAA